MLKSINSKLNYQTLFTLSTVFNLAKMSSATCSLDKKSSNLDDLSNSYSITYVTIDNEENSVKLAR